MCFAVYIGSNIDLSGVQTGEWKEDMHEAYVSFRTITSAEKEALSHYKKFTQKHIFYARSNQGCGCGFYKGTTPEELLLDSKEWGIRKGNYKLLANILGTYPAQNFEVFACWDGDQFYKDIVQTVEISADRLEDEHFSFEELYFYKISQGDHTPSV